MFRLWNKVGNIFKETSSRDNKLVLRCFIDTMDPQPVRHPLEDYLEEEYLEEAPTVEDTSVELKVRAEDIAAREKQQQELSDLLDVLNLIGYQKKYTMCLNDLGNLKHKSYHSPKQDLFWGGATGAITGTITWRYIMVILNPDNPAWLMSIFVAAGVGIVAGGYTQSKFMQHISEKQFEEEKKAKLDQLNQEEEDLEYKLSLYDRNTTQNAVVLFRNDKTGYSIGDVQSVETDYIKVRQEYQVEEENVSERRTPKYKVKPDELYVLSTSHELSDDDLKTMKEGTPLSVDSDGFTKFGFAKNEENKLNLYTDSKCTFLSYTCNQEELSTATVRKLIPKLNENHPQHPYR